MLFRIKLTIAILVISLSSTVGATELTGKLKVSKSFLTELEALRAKQDKADERGYWNEPNGIKPISPPKVDYASDFGVALFKKDGAAPEADAVKTIEVKTGSLSQRVVVIRPKSRIKFIVRSPYDHELYAPAKHDFKPEKQSTNSFRPIDFYSAGIFEVKCKLFPHFQGWIVVVPAQRVVSVKADGSFVVPDLEEGEYTIKVNFEGKWIHEETFTVSGRKQDQQVALKTATESASKEKKKSKPEKENNK